MNAFRFALGAMIRLIALGGLIFGVVQPAFWRWLYPLDYPDVIAAAADEAGLDPSLVAAVIRAESGFYHDASSKKGARGLMQLLDETRDWALSRSGLDRRFPEEMRDAPEVNIRLGSWYIRHLIDRFDGNAIAALAAYNAGPANVDRWLATGTWNGTAQAIGDIPFGETRHYLARVLYLQHRYRQVYGNLLNAR
ncbi:MAG: lytic transglycosylase domain-containing protein [Hydrogenibacillus sp.]|nr:lytic transglycosylase domain-containing protein [Hydrogenibacillus sp.]